MLRLPPRPASLTGRNLRRRHLRLHRRRPSRLCPASAPRSDRTRTPSEFRSRCRSRGAPACHPARTVARADRDQPGSEYIVTRSSAIFSPSFVPPPVLAERAATFVVGARIERAEQTAHDVAQPLPVRAPPCRGRARSLLDCDSPRPSAMRCDRVPPRRSLLQSRAPAFDQPEPVPSGVRAVMPRFALVLR